MKILVLNGSPKKQSDTMQMTSSFLKGINKHNTHDIKIVNIIEKNINFCQGCLKCWFIQDGHCVIQDDMNGLLDDIVASDMVIWSSPLYRSGFPAHLKTVLDRTIPFLKINMKRDGNRIIHENVIDMPGKKTMVIVGYGYPYFEDNIAPLKLQCRVCFDNLTMVCVSEMALLSAPGAEALKNSLLDKFEEAGQEYGKKDQLSEQTIKELETQLMPTDAYIDIINSLG